MCLGPTTQTLTLGMIHSIPFAPDEWSEQTSTMLKTYFIQNLPDPHGPEPVPSGSIS